MIIYNQKKLFLFLVGFVSIIGHFRPQIYAETVSSLDLPLKSTGDLIFYADIYQFEKSDSTNRVEICYSLDLSQIQSENSPDEKCTLALELQIVNKAGQPVEKRVDKKIITMTKSAEGESGAFLDLQKFDLVLDTMALRLSISDPVSGKKGTIQKKFDVYRFPKRLSLSDPVFIAYIQKSTQENNLFNRHNIMMVPNPARLFDVSPDQSHMYVYFDINNLEYDPQKTSFYHLECTIEDLSGRQLKNIVYEQIKKIGNNTSRIEKINLDSLGNGIYAFNIKIADLEDDQTASVKRYFQTISNQGNADLFMPMTEADVNKYLDQIKYIATDKELKLFKQLDNVGKQEFLLSFWKSKDPTPDTRENEFMLEHFKRIDYCEKHFKSGINCDQGRIYIQYGPPLDIERRTSTQGYSRPLEIWTYSIEGRVEFIFVDRANDGTYLLMHSTHPDEYSNPNWMNEIR